MKSLLLMFFMMGAAGAGELRMNEVQVIGTHNSYHVAPKAELMRMVSVFNKKALQAWGYSHKPLDEQLEAGVRQFELDVFADPEGGLYAETGHDQLAEMKKPGVKVLHVPKLDFRSNHATLVAALKAVKGWSGKNRNHVPVMILIELKDSKEVPFGPTPVKFDRAQMEELEQEILSVFKREELVTPDGVRGDAKTLREAVLQKGWPSLESARGKVMFCLDNEGRHREIYLKGNRSLEGRLLFVSVDRTHSAAGFMKRNDPRRGFDEIQKLVKEGFMVRTRADGDSREAYAHDLSRAGKALASGAQFVSTDYPEADPKVGMYEVKLPGGVVARANPLSGVKRPAGELE
ncbi:phosphatidylinositol-specific phospholipase C1-like protein [Verrucomicrobiaceae bacterium 227]